MKISERALGMETSPIRKLAPYAEAAKQKTEREEDLSPEYRAAGHCYFAKVYGSYP